MRVLIIQGSPDVASYPQELVNTYAEGASGAGHEVRIIDLVTEDFNSDLRYGYCKHMKDESAPERYQELIAWADHLVPSFPIWQSTEPAIPKGFIDRAFTLHFAYRLVDGKSEAELTGEAAALILTSRVSALIYRLFGGLVTRRKHMILDFVSICLTGTSIFSKIGHPQDTPEHRVESVEKVRHYARH